MQTQQLTNLSHSVTPLVYKPVTLCSTPSLQTVTFRNTLGSHSERCRLTHLSLNLNMGACVKNGDI